MTEESNAIGVVAYREDYVLFSVTQARLVSPQTGEILKQVAESLIKKGHKKIVLSFSQVEFMSSGILGALISVATRLRNIRGSLSIVSVRPEIKELFVITQLDKVIHIQ